MNIGSIIKYYRLRNGMTQAELAEGICSVSHLSKIETNKYSPHIKTIEDLFNRMNIKWENEVHIYKSFEEKLSEFFSYAIYYDLESMERLHDELKKDEDYIQSTDLLNKYELYKLRYYLYKGDTSRAKQQMQLIEKLATSFNASEQIIAVVIAITFYGFVGDDERAERLFSQIDADADIKSFPKLLEGEYFYQRAWILHKWAQYDKSSYYASFAIDHFQKDCNYIRLMHAQMLLAINYTNRDYYLWAEELFMILMRNTRMMRQEVLYHHTLYNLSILHERMGNQIKAYEYLVKLKSMISTKSELYDPVLLNMLHISIGTDREDLKMIEELRNRVNGTNGSYLELQLKYFEHMKLTQQELYDYCENIMFPFLNKFGNIRESQRMARRLAKFYREKKDFEKADFYNNYYDEEGDVS